MQTDRKRLLIISFSNIATDPRVIKQVQLFVKKYDVITCGFGETPPNVSKHIQLTNSPYWKYSKTKLLTKLYESNYWKNDRVIDALSKLKSEKNFDAIISNDLEAVPLAVTLNPVYGVHADLHEYSPKMREEDLKWKIVIAPFLNWIGKKYLPKAKSVTTVSKIIAAEYKKNCKLKEVTVVPNATPYINLQPSALSGRIKLVHSGAALANRGILEVVKAVKKSKKDISFDLYLIPSDPGYFQLIKSEIENDSRIRILKPVKYSGLIETLNQYDVGIHVMPPVNFNTRSALPNKFFDYVQARLGLLIGPTPEMVNILNEYQLGLSTTDFSVASITAALDQLSLEKVAEWKLNSAAAAEPLSAERQISNWENAVDSLFIESK